MRELDNIVLARTSDNLVRARFSSIKVFIKLELRSYYAIRRLFERQTLEYRNTSVNLVQCVLLSKKIGHGLNYRWYARARYHRSQIDLTRIQLDFLK